MPLCLNSFIWKMEMVIPTSAGERKELFCVKGLKEYLGTRRVSAMISVGELSGKRDVTLLVRLCMKKHGP